MRDRRLLWFLLIFMGCSSPEPAGSGLPEPPKSAEEPSAPHLARIAPLAFPIGATESAGVAAARLDDRDVVFVADADDRAVLTLDAKTLAPLARVALERAPRDLLVLRRGVVLATLPEANAVAVLESAGANGELRVERLVKTSTEPLSMAVNKLGNKVAVTAGAGHHVDILSADTLASESTQDVAREPRAVLFTQNDKMFVTHATQGSLTTGFDPIELGIATGSFDTKSSEPPRFARHANALIRVFGDDGSERIYVPVVQNAPRHGAPPGGYGGGSSSFGWGKWGKPEPLDFGFDFDDGDPREVRRRARERQDREERERERREKEGPPNKMSSFDLRVVDASTAKIADLEGRAPERPGHVPALLRSCLLPRAGVATSKARILVACEGDSEAISLDATSTWPSVVGRYATGRGPSAIARVDADHVVVWSPLARQLSRFTTEGDGDKQPLVARELPRSLTIDAKILAGRELFMRNGDERISKDGLACATCHPGARDDGLVWQTPMGDRRPRTLAGNINRTTRFGWGAEHENIHSHVKETMKRLRGKGLPDEDLDAIFAYLGSLPPVPVADVPREPDAMRGAQVFASDRAACSTCHEPENGFTDNRAHLLGYGSLSITPSLVGVGARKRLFHDGRYGSFDEMLKNEVRNEYNYWTPMGGGGKLTADERKDLVAYLRTL